VAAELPHAAAKKGPARLTAQVEAILGAIEVLPFEEPADRVYGVLRYGLERKGEPIDGNDLLIAAQRLSLGFTLVTANEREFAKIGDLQYEKLDCLVSPRRNSPFHALSERTVLNPEILAHGTRLPVEFILKLLAAGQSEATS